MKFWAAIAGLFASLAGAWRTMFMARKSGERKERLKHVERKNEALEKANEIQREMLEVDRPDPDDTRKRLRDGSA